VLSSKWGFPSSPARALKKISPPIVTGSSAPTSPCHSHSNLRSPPPFHTGIVILLIGASLIGASGVPNQLQAGGYNSCTDPNPTGFFAPSVLASSRPRPLPWRFTRVHRPRSMAPPPRTRTSIAIYSTIYIYIAMGVVSKRRRRLLFLWYV
jgi:hypothetical protein